MVIFKEDLRRILFSKILEFGNHQLLVGDLFSTLLSLIVFVCVFEQKKKLRHILAVKKIKRRKGRRSGESRGKTVIVRVKILENYSLKTRGINYPSHYLI